MSWQKVREWHLEWSKLVCEGTNFEFSSVSNRGEEENLCLGHHAITGEEPDTDLDEKISIFWQLIKI